MAVEDFFKDYFETALEPGELLAEIQVPNPPANTGTTFKKFSKVASDYAIVSTAVSITMNSETGICAGVRIALGAVAPIPMRAKRVEKYWGYRRTISCR